MGHIKKYNEFATDRLLDKPEVDFGCLSISVNELKRWYESVKDAIDDGVSDHEHDLFKGGSVIYERKGDLLPFDDFAKWIVEKYKFGSNQFIRKEYNNGIGLYIAIYKDDSIAEMLDTDMRMNGYFLSKSEVNGQVVHLFFEPLVQANVNNIVFARDFIYHYTPYVNFDGIMENGLEPKSNENPVYKYPPRVYFTLYENSALANSLRKNRIENGIKDDAHYMLLKIDIRDLKGDIDFYFDAYGANCVFTPNLILPQYIKPFKEGYLLGGSSFKITKEY